MYPFELEIKMADEDEIFRKFRRKTPEWMADFEKPCFNLELEIFKSTLIRCMNHGSRFYSHADRNMAAENLIVRLEVALDSVHRLAG